MDYRVVEAVHEDFIAGMEFVEHYVAKIYMSPGQIGQCDRNSRSILLDWAYVNIVKGYDEPISERPKPGNILNRDDIEKFEDFYIKVLYPAYRNREKNILLYFGKSTASNQFKFIDITSKPFGPNDNFKNGSKSDLDEIYNF